MRVSRKPTLGHGATVRGSYGKVRGTFWKIIGVALNLLLRCLGILILLDDCRLCDSHILGPQPWRAVAVPNMSQCAVTAVMAIVGVLLFVLAYLAVLVLFTAFTMRYAVIIPALLIEKLTVLSAFRRSVHLTQGRRWHIFLAFLLAMVLAYVGMIVFQGPFLAAMMFYVRGGQVPPWLTP